MSDIEVVEALYQAMAARDIERLVQLIHPDCVITQDPRVPWGGRHVGHEGFANFGLLLTSSIDSAVTTEAMFMADDEVIQVGRTRGTVKSNGAAFDIAEVHRWKIRDGQAVSAHFAIDTEAMVRALNSG
jgi:ketosteroid isomerase-like protein